VDFGTKTKEQHEKFSNIVRGKYLTCA